MSEELNEKKFNRAILFSGGGTRFAIYLGMYAALVDLKLKPDLIIASCGGAIASTIITAFPEIEDQKKYIKSQELYQFIINTKLTREKSISKLGFYALKKVFQKREAPIIEDVLNRYLVIMSQNLHELPSISNVAFDNNTIIIGAKILFSKNDVLKPRNNKKLYRKLILANPYIINSIDASKIEINSENYFKSAVDSKIELSSQFNLSQAMRISISDMFYVEPFQQDSTIYAGGVIDLVPIELAKYLANEIIIEKKQRFTPVETSLVRAVLGFDSNVRLDEIDRENIPYQIDTRDAPTYLKGKYFSQIIDWKKVQLSLDYPTSYANFTESMDAQWQYGYDRTIQVFK